MSRPFVSIVVPTLNEERYVEAAIMSLLPQSDSFDYELLVLDGGSMDRTCDIVAKLARTNPHVRLIDNPRRIQSAAMNIAAEACDPRSAIIIRADCHAIYPAGFIENCAKSLMRAESSSVVVPMRAVGQSSIQRAIAAAQNSVLGNGGSRHRRRASSGFVEHGHHAAFLRDAFCSIGGYDESAPFNEDAEFDVRLLRSGGRIYLDGQLAIDYYPRSSFLALARQYFCHGWGRANTVLKHGMLPKLRQLLPVAALFLCVSSLLASAFLGTAGLLPAAGYFAVCLIWGACLALHFRQPILLLAGPAAITMHLSWGSGFVIRIAKQAITATSKNSERVGRAAMAGQKGPNAYLS